MEKNVGKVDKAIRLIVGILLIYLAFILDNRLTIIIVAGLGTISIYESYTGFCELYKLFKKNTNRR